MQDFRGVWEGEEWSARVSQASCYLHGRPREASAWQPSECNSKSLRFQHWYLGVAIGAWNSCGGNRWGLAMWFNRAALIGLERLRRPQWIQDFLWERLWVDPGCSPTRFQKEPVQPTHQVDVLDDMPVREEPQHCALELWLWHWCSWLSGPPTNTPLIIQYPKKVFSKCHKCGMRGQTYWTRTTILETPNAY